MSQLSVELRHAKRSNLTQVDLSKRFITSLPKELYSILSLQHLNLNYNNISHIDSSIAQLEKLQTLLLQGNDLAQLPREILHLKDLTILQLKGNPLTGKFTSLLKLDNCCKQENLLKNCFQFAENRLSATPSWLLQHHQKEISQRNSYEKDYLAQKLRISPKKKIVQRRPMSIKSQSQLDYQRQSKNGTLIANNSDLKLQKQVYKCQRYTLFKGEYCGLQVSIKVYPQENQQSISFFKNQLKIMTIYRHPNIANLLAVCQSDSLHLITQGFSKSLKEIMRNRQENLNNEQRSRIINQLASTVSFLHGNGVIHGEISSFSIFLDSNFNLKLTNFQSARHQVQLYVVRVKFRLAKQIVQHIYSFIQHHNVDNQKLLPSNQMFLQLERQSMNSTLDLWLFSLYKQNNSSIAHIIRRYCLDTARQSNRFGKKVLLHQNSKKLQKQITFLKAYLLIVAQIQRLVII